MARRAERSAGLLGPLLGQARRALPMLLALYASSALLFGLVVFAKLALGIPVKVFLYDAVELRRSGEIPAGLESLAGLVSYLGIVLWGCAAVLSLVYRWLLRRLGRPELSALLAALASASLVLMSDDLLTLHETLARTTPLSEAVIQAGYGVMLALVLLWFRREILARDFLLLLLSLVWFAASVALDAVHFLPGSILLEDLFKFLGIVTWLGYVVELGAGEILEGQERTRDLSPSPDLV